MNDLPIIIFNIYFDDYSWINPKNPKKHYQKKFKKRIKTTYSQIEEIRKKYLKKYGKKSEGDKPEERVEQKHISFRYRYLVITKTIEQNERKRP